MKKFISGFRLALGACFGTARGREYAAMHDLVIYPE